MVDCNIEVSSNSSLVITFTFEHILGKAINPINFSSYGLDNIDPVLLQKNGFGIR